MGADGATHGGAFDITYMACLPNMVVMAPSNEAELIHMVATSAAIDDRPSCFRSALLVSAISALLTIAASDPWSSWHAGWCTWVTAASCPL